MCKLVTFVLLTVFAACGLCPASDPAALPQSTLPAKGYDCLCTSQCSCGPDCRCGWPTLMLAAVVVDPLTEEPRQAPPSPQPNSDPPVNPAPATVVISGCGPGTVLSLNGVSQYGFGYSRTVTTPVISGPSHYALTAAEWEGAGKTITGYVDLLPGRVTLVTLDWSGLKVVATVGAARRVVGYRQVCTGSGCRVIAVYEGDAGCPCVSAPGGVGTCGSYACPANGGGGGCPCVSGEGYGGGCASGSCSSESGGGSCGSGVGRRFRIFHRLFHPFRGRSRRGGCSSCG